MSPSAAFVLCVVLSSSLLRCILKLTALLGGHCSQDCTDCWTSLLDSGKLPPCHHETASGHCCGATGTVAASVLPLPGTMLWHLPTAMLPTPPSVLLGSSLHPGGPALQWCGRPHPCCAVSCWPATKYGGSPCDWMRGLGNGVPVAAEAMRMVPLRPHNVQAAGLISQSCRRVSNCLCCCTRPIVSQAPGQDRCVWADVTS